MVALGRSVVEVEAVVRWWHGGGSGGYKGTLRGAA